MNLRLTEVDIPPVGLIEDCDHRYVTPVEWVVYALKPIGTTAKETVKVLVLRCHCGKETRR